MARGNISKKSRLTPLSITSRVLLVTLKLVTLLLCLVYLGSVASVWISPARIVSPAFLGLAFPVFLVLMLLALFFWLLAARWSIVVALVLVLVLSLNSITSYMPIHRATPQDKLPSGVIKVLSYNVMSFGFLEHSPQSPNPILQFIKSSGADIVCLQEAMLSPESSQFVSLEDVKAYLPQYRYHDYRTVQNDAGGGMLLLSKFPILSSRRLPIESDYNGSVVYVLSVNGQKVTVINNHLESFRLTMEDGKQYLKMVKEGDAAALREKMGAKFAPAYRKRSLQADLIHEVIVREGTERIIVCGDFNDTPISYVRHRIARGLTDTFIASGLGVGVSFNRGYYAVRIDHILCGSGFKPYNTFVDNTIKASDHFPILTILDPLFLKPAAN
ncbi:AP endonuclease [Porphyromonas macacae]|uniref:AP endonuclease n=1 Tax=Porphyromonas macacae TaxID=28115 RepID=A0A0A2EA18_9PORP|nr:endonuclease/exonuclease/phosphatase family protein [Porphyromonas macacae]KGN73284.1 AP endonuclease [Porphyromonas macacae]